MATQCIAEAISRADLRKIAKVVRGMEGAQDTMFFDIVHFLDVTLPQFYSEFNLRILTKSEMGDCHGLTFPDRNEIRIREDVYERAAGGSGRDRMTMAHELGHFLLHEKKNISYARMEGGQIPVFMNPEWQADAFGGELLIPYYMIVGKSCQEIVRQCRVSEKAALCQMKK